MFKNKLFKVVLLMVVAVLLVTACGQQETPPPATDTPVEEEVATEEEMDTEEPTEVPPTEEPTEVPPTETPEPVEVSLRLPWIINAQFAGPFMALEKGYFAEEGLDVSIKPGGFDINSITLVASGEDTFGLHDMGSLINARANDIPVVAGATFFQKHPGGLMALEESGIETLEDIEGKTIGFQEGGPWMLSKAMLESNGIDLDTIEKITVGFDISPLLNGQIDLMTVYATNEPLIAEGQGYGVNVFLPYDYGIETSSEALFTTESYLSENPEQMCGMVRAIQKGWQYAVDNKEETIDVIMEQGGEGLDREAEMAQLNAELDHLITPDAEEHGLGYMTQERWQTAEDVLSQYGQLEEDVDITNVFTMQCFEE